MTSSPSLLPEVDVVIPSFNEPALAIRRTMDALRRQTHQPRSITFVDDCSPDRAGLKAAEAAGARTLRMERNGGISAARNAGLRASTAPLVAFVNVEVLLADDWLATCASHMQLHARVAVTTARTVPENQRSLVTRWRMRYHEVAYPTTTGPIAWGSGHALLFRRDALLAIGGFDERRWKAGEDVDACFRLGAAGWNVHFVSATQATSIQEDSWATIARAEYNRSIWRADSGNGLWRGLAIATDRTIQRSLRHVLFLRWPLLYVEVGVYLAQLPRHWRHR